MEAALPSFTVATHRERQVAAVVAGLTELSAEVQEQHQVLSARQLDRMQDWVSKSLALFTGACYVFEWSFPLIPLAYASNTQSLQSLQVHGQDRAPFRARWKLRLR